MAETKLIGFAFPEIAKILVKEQDIHEGHWGIFVRFGIAGGNVPKKIEAGDSSTEARDVLPAAIVPILELGIQRFDSPNSLTVDATKVNPRPKGKRVARKKDRENS